MKVWIAISIGFVLMVILGCIKNETEKADIESDLAYFPLQVGQYREYKVDSILYRQGKFLDSTSSFIREEITTKVTDTLGEEYIILRSIRKNDIDPWVPNASFTARIYYFKAVRNEGNVHLVCLVFPFIINQSWEGLSLINTDQVYDVQGESVQIYQGWEPFKIKENAKPEIISGLNYRDVVTVLQSDEEDILTKRYSLEKYAKGVGLVYKEMAIYDCNSQINTCSNGVPWNKRATKGYFMRQTLLKHN